MSLLDFDLHLPSRAASGMLVVCSPGGGIGRGYFDLHPRGRQGFSLVEHLTARGHAVAAVDLLGTAPGDRGGDEIRMSTAAAALATTTRRLSTRVSDALGSAPRIVGLGHSLGAAVTVAAATAHGCFDGVVLLGQSPAWRSVAAVPPGSPPRPDHPDEVREWTRARLEEAQPEVWHNEQVRFPVAEPDTFAYHDEVPPDVRAAVHADGPAVPRGLALDYGIPEPALEAARRLDTPVLLVFGQPDASASPEREAAFYPRSWSVEIVQLPGSAHVHLASRARNELMTAVGDWIEATFSIRSRETP